MPIHANFFLPAILGQTDIVFGMRRGFISRSVRATLVDKRSPYMQRLIICATLVNIQTDTHRETAF